MTLGGDLSLPKAMEVIMLLGQIQGPIHHFQHIQNQLVDLNMCVIRIQDYLAQPELDTTQIEQAKPEHPDYAVYIENKNFSWGVQTKDVDELFDKMAMDMRGETQEERDSRKTKKQLEQELERKMNKMKDRAKQRKLDTIVCLKDITLKIKKGQFVCIIGKVGSGKSSLLSTICGELLELPQQLVDHFKGDADMEKELNDQEAEAIQEEMMRINATHKALEVNGSIAYTAQNPWIRNRNIRENILYDLPFDLDKYVDTVQYCEFERDIGLQREGDQTLIGDRGVTLSGGQKARLGLARALYQDKELYLMDDPISALDAHVRSQIIKNVYFGKLKDRTRILVTHAIDFLPKADHIVMMDQGRIICQGTYEELDKNEQFKELMEINKLNKEVPKEDEKDKDSAEGDTVTEGDISSEEEQLDNSPKNLADLDLEEDDKLNDDEDKAEAMKKIIEARVKKMSRKTSKKKSKVEAEDSSDVEGSDKCDTDDEEEKLPDVVYPSKLTKAEKLLKMKKFQTIKPKKKQEVDDKNNLGGDSDSDEDETGEESNKINQKV